MSYDLLHLISLGATEDKKPVDISLLDAIITIGSLHLMTQVCLQQGLFARLLRSPSGIAGQLVGCRVSPLAPPQ